MLRICYCLSHYHPIASGAERQAHLQAVQLTRRGHRVLVLTRAVEGHPDQEELDGVSIRRVIRPRQLGPVFGLSFVWTLRAGLRRFRNEFDLVHCHQSLWEAVATGLTAPGLGRPSLVQPAAGGEYGEVHQLDRTRGQKVLRKLILRNQHFVAISAQIEQELIELGVPPSRLTRLLSGVDTAAFSPGPSLLEGQLPHRPRVLFLGRLHGQKNLGILLAAWQTVRTQLAASLILAGDGPELASLRSQAETLGIADSVHLIGAVTNPVEYLRAADVFVLPSVAEGMSNSLLEAMAVAVPPVVSRIGGNTDLVVDGESGRWIEPGSVSSLSGALIELLQNPDRGKRLGNSAREVVRGKYSIQRVVDQYVELYEKLLAAPGR